MTAPSPTDIMRSLFSVDASRAAAARVFAAPAPSPLKVAPLGTGAGAVDGLVRAFVQRWRAAKARVATTFAIVDDVSTRARAVGIIRELIARAEGRR